MYRRVRHPDQNTNPNKDGQASKKKVYDLVRSNASSIIEGDSVGDKPAKNLSQAYKKSVTGCGYDGVVHQSHRSM